MFYFNGNSNSSLLALGVLQKDVIMINFDDKCDKCSHVRTMSIIFCAKQNYKGKKQRIMFNSYAKGKGKLF